MLATSKYFPQFVEKIEKLKLSLFKQRNKMLKMRSEMLKTGKSKTIEFGKKSRGFSGYREFTRIPGKFFENFSFPGKLKNRERGNP